MIPAHIELFYIDREVRHLVVNLNRIPGVNTQTTCEGHIWEDIPRWPTKDGWVHFDRPKNKNEGLIEVVHNFCIGTDFFNLEEWGESQSINRLSYTISALYENHCGFRGEKPYYKWSKQEQQAYIQRAKIRRLEIFKGWSGLNDVVVNFIRKNINPDIYVLPFRYKE